MMKHLLQNKEFQLDEILFQGRNKEYGAYALRSEADRILTRSMFAGIAIFGLVAATPFIVNAFKAEAPVTIPGKSGPFIIIDVETPNVKPPVETVKPPAQVNTVVSQIPNPTANPTKEDPPATIDESKDAVRGFEQIKGDPPVMNFNPPVVTTTGSGTAEPKTVPIKTDENVVATKVDVEADFSGGIKAFREKMVQNFDTSSFDGIGEKISTTITFIVEKDGTISNIKTSGNDSGFNREAERTIKKIKGKWTPAQLKGEPVRSYFRFPVSMMFE